MELKICRECYYAAGNKADICPVCGSDSVLIVDTQDPYQTQLMLAEARHNKVSLNQAVDARLERDDSVALYDELLQRYEVLENIAGMLIDCAAADSNSNEMNVTRNFWGAIENKAASLGYTIAALTVLETHDTVIHDIRDTYATDYHVDADSSAADLSNFNYSEPMGTE